MRVCLMLEMSETELDQLRAYVRWCEEKGDYYGPKDQFWKRHRSIRKALGMPEGDLVGGSDVVGS